MRGGLGPCPEDDKSNWILNRVVEWTEAGITYEPDHRHAEIIIDQLKVFITGRNLSVPSRRNQKKNEILMTLFLCHPILLYTELLLHELIIFGKIAQTFDSPQKNWQSIWPIPKCPVGMRWSILVVIWKEKRGTSRDLIIKKMIPRTV